MNIVKKTSTYNTTWASNRKIEYIVIHYTAGVTSKSGSARNIASYFANPDIEASADFIVDDSEIVQYNPDIKNRYCWSVGGSKLATKGGKCYGWASNKNTVNIEICSSNSTGRITNANDKYFYFTDAAVKKAVELTKYLMQEYKIDINHVIRHYDVTGKYCPGVIGWNADSGSENKWQNFKSQLSGVVENPKGTSYTIKVSNSVNLYKSATTASKCGTVPKGVYTIVQELNGFGKLKSGAGWVKLNECKNEVIEKGSIVKVKNGAKNYDNGKSLASFVYTSNYYVMELVRDRAVIGIDGNVTAAVKVSDLILVK